MKKFVSLFVMALIAATPAMAFDQLITNDTAAVQEAETMKAEVTVVYTTASDAFDKDGESGELGDDYTSMMIPVKFRYGVMENLEAFGVLGLVEQWDSGAADDTGIGDLWLGAKYSVMPDGMFTVRGALDIPLGDDEKGLGNAGGFGIDIAAMTTKQMDAIGLNGQAGIRYNVEDGDTKIQPGFGFYLDGEGSYAITDVFKAQLGLELMFAGDSKFDGDDVADSAMNWIELNVGGCYALGESMGLKGDFIYDIAGANTNQNMGVVISFFYGL